MGKPEKGKSKKEIKQERKKNSLVENQKERKKQTVRTVKKYMVIVLHLRGCVRSCCTILLICVFHTIMLCRVYVLYLFRSVFFTIIYSFT